MSILKHGTERSSAFIFVCEQKLSNYSHIHIGRLSLQPTEKPKKIQCYIMDFFYINQWVWTEDVSHKSLLVADRRYKNESQNIVRKNIDDSMTLIYKLSESKAHHELVTLDDRDEGLLCYLHTNGTCMQFIHFIQQTPSIQNTFSILGNIWRSVYEFVYVYMVHAYWKTSVRTFIYNIYSTINAKATALKKKQHSTTFIWIQLEKSFYFFVVQITRGFNRWISDVYWRKRK